MMPTKMWNRFFLNGDVKDSFFLDIRTLSSEWQVGHDIKPIRKDYIPSTLFGSTVNNIHLLAVIL